MSKKLSFTLSFIIILLIAIFAIFSIVTMPKSNEPIAEATKITNKILIGSNSTGSLEQNIENTNYNAIRLSLSLDDYNYIKDNSYSLNISLIRDSDQKKFDLKLLDYLAFSDTTHYLLAFEIPSDFLTTEFPLGFSAFITLTEKIMNNEAVYNQIVMESDVLGELSVTESGNDKYVNSLKMKLKLNVLVEPSKSIKLNTEVVNNSINTPENQVGYKVIFDNFKDYINKDDTYFYFDVVVNDFYFLGTFGYEKSSIGEWNNTLVNVSQTFSFINVSTDTKEFNLTVIIRIGHIEDEIFNNERISYEFNIDEKLVYKDFITITFN